MYSKEIPSDTPDFEPIKVRATGRGVSINDGFGAIYVKGTEIDAVAIALIQATPQRTRPLPPPESWSDLDADAALELGLALIRSVK